ncbi:transposase [Streptococcus pneumoniae]|nr:transposase [Streptococcus pneumoniae]
MQRFHQFTSACQNTQLPNTGTILVLQLQTQTDFQQEIKVYYADEPESAPQKGLYMNERYQNLKAKECQALLSPQGRQIFAQRKIDVEPVFGQIKASLGYKRCNLRGK